MSRHSIDIQQVADEFYVQQVADEQNLSVGEARWVVENRDRREARKNAVIARKLIEEVQRDE